MKIAYIFPGQGTQVVGMGKDIYDKYEEAINLIKMHNHDIISQEFVAF